MAALKITGAGATAEYLGQKVSVKKHFDTFAATDASELGGIKWDALSEETLCSKDVYERFAYFLMQVHPNGLKLGLDGRKEAAFFFLLVALGEPFGAIDDDQDAARCAHALRLRWCARATRATALAWRPTAARRRRPEAASRWPAAASGAARFAADAAAAPATRAAAALAALAPARARE